MSVYHTTIHTFINLQKFNNNNNNNKKRKNEKEKRKSRKGGRGARHTVDNKAEAINE